MTSISSQRTNEPLRGARSKIDFATAAIRELIVEGELAPGTALKQRDLAARLGVSVTPVREALRRVESEGLVSFNHHTGATVVQVDFGATEEIDLIRAALEPLATSLAVPNLTNHDVDVLKGLNRQMRACGDRDLDLLARLNRQFHFTIYDRAGSPVLNSFIVRLWRTFDTGPQVIVGLEQTLNQHDLIIAAIEARQPSIAAEATRLHIACDWGLDNAPDEDS